MRNQLSIGNEYKLKYIKRTLDLIMMGYQNDSSMLYIHVEGFFRAFRRDKLLFTSSDLYRPKLEVDEPFDWTSPGTTLFDSCIEKHQSILNDLTLKKIYVIGKDVKLKFNKDVVFQILVDTTEEEEKIRIFTDNEELLVINS